MNKEYVSKKTLVGLSTDEEVLLNAYDKLVAQPQRVQAENSLHAQVRRHIKNGYARHLGGEIYRFSLSTPGCWMTAYDLRIALEPLGLPENAIQYVEQRRGVVVVNLRLDENFLAEFRA